MRSLLQLRKTTRARVPCSVRGVTLIELMIAITVAAVLTLIAVPSFTSAINTNRLKTTANTLIGALNNARMAAVQRNAFVQFCSNSATSNTTDTLGGACGTSAGAVFALTSPGATTFTQLAAAPSELSIPSIQISGGGTIAAIRFNSQGQGLNPSTLTPFDTSTGGAVVDICSTGISTNNHIQINMAAGSIISTTTSSGACP